MRTSIVFLLLLWSHLPAWGGGTREPTEVRPSAGLRQDPTCAERLKQSAEDALDRLNGSGGRASLGYYDELRGLLEQSGVKPPRASQIVYEIHRLRSTADEVVGLDRVNFALSEFIRTKMLVFCVPSKKCTLAASDENHAAFGAHREGILILPPAEDSSPRRWAINFLGTVASFAAEQILLQWVHVGFHKEQVLFGSADEYYRGFVQRFDGGCPGIDTFRDGFAVVFMQVFQTLVTQNLFANYYPKDAQRNAVHLARSAYRQLTSGPKAPVHLRILGELGITQYNLLERTGEIYRTIDETLREMPEG